MNLNILSYVLYILVTFILIVHLGRYFHKNGRVFILFLFRNDVKIADSANNLLLILYYLLNMGYASVQLYYWVKIQSMAQLFGALNAKFALIILLLAGIHYINMLVLFILSKRQNKNHSLTS